MPKITFADDGLEVEAETGSKLADIADEAGASIDFSCRQGLCSTCLITVIEGMENLEPAKEPELTTLSDQGAETDQRLACQCRVKGDVVVERA